MNIWLPIVALVVVALFAVFAYVLWKNKKKTKPIQLAPAVGAILGAVIGIALAELHYLDYPAPFILMFLGLAAGQLVVWFSQQNRKRNR
ncbi:MAG: hypothetical protein V1881_02780 [Candidatus Micrarchaeota archaeon]